MNIFSQAKNGIISEDVKTVSSLESIPVSTVLKDFAEGRITILRNKRRNITPVGVGKGLSTKINANIGTSPDLFSLENEMLKLKAAVDNGANAIMDLSTGGDLSFFRKKILENSPVPLGTVPIYEAAVRMVSQKKSLVEMRYRLITIIAI